MIHAILKGKLISLQKLKEKGAKITSTETTFLSSRKHIDEIYSLKIETKEEQSIIDSIVLHTLANPNIGEYDEFNKKYESNLLNKVLKGNNIFHLYSQYHDGNYDFRVELIKVLTSGKYDHLRYEKNKKGQIALAIALSNYLKDDIVELFNEKIDPSDTNLIELCINLVRNGKNLDFDWILGMTSNEFDRETLEETILKAVNERTQIDSSNKVTNQLKNDNHKRINAYNVDTINIVEAVLNLSLQLISLFDLITDIILLRLLITANHAAWTALSFLTIFIPYFISYSGVVSFLMERGTFEMEDTNITTQGYIKLNTKATRRLFGWFFMTPLSIIYFVILDFIYIAVDVYVSLHNFIIYTFTRGRGRRLDSDKYLDALFNKLFNLFSMDAKGLRRLKCISQTIFESVPQIILQIRILTAGAEDVGITLSTLIASLSAAILHLLLQIFLLHFESSGCKESILQYMVICMNGRLNWVPFIDKLTAGSSSNESREYDYRKLEYQLCGKKFGMDYEFYPTTLKMFGTEVSKIPKEENEAKRIKMRIGKTRNIDFNEFFKLLEYANGRVMLINDDWDAILRDTSRKDMKEMDLDFQ